jgi:hypothetical protein
MLLVIFIAFSIATDVNDNLSGPLVEWDVAGLKLYDCVEMKEDHSNRQPNQPPQTWTNVSFPIPDYVTYIRLKAYAVSNATQEIPYYSVDELGRFIDVSVTWWGPPWELCIFIR